MNVANLYSHWGKYETALSYLKKEEKMCRDSGSTDYLAEVCQNLGHYYIIVNQYDKALAYFQESLELARKSDNKINLHAILNSMGVLCCFHLDKPESALSYLEQALSYANSIGDLRVIAHGKAALSGCLGKLKCYQEALDHAIEAQQISQKFGYRQVEAIAPARSPMPTGTTVTDSSESGMPSKCASSGSPGKMPMAILCLAYFLKP
ncbi:MAG: tetratricopeptide repeat protein [Synechococcales cyanobacterium RM1_1_8]|nr:tetratricopeptide repeat protein [Synechococcales cyanobacterium RM1_1_8]